MGNSRRTTWRNPFDPGYMPPSVEESPSGFCELGNGPDDGYGVEEANVELPIEKPALPPLPTLPSDALPPSPSKSASGASRPPGTPIVAIVAAPPPSRSQSAPPYFSPGRIGAPRP